MPEILMGCWDCASCGIKGVRGDAYNCHGCGAGRPENVEFYLPRNAERVTDAAGLRAAKAGPDWKCDYCEEWNSAVHKTCTNCAGGTEKGAKKQRTETRSGGPASFTKDTPANVFEEHSMEYERKPARAPIQAPGWYAPGLADQVSRPNVSLGQVAGTFLGVLAFVGLLWIVTRSYPVLATISHHTWQRVQHTEVFRTGLDREGWDTPSDAYQVRTSSRIHHYNKVIDHYVTEPVYSTRTVASGSEPIYSSRTVNLGNGRYSTETYQNGSRTIYRSETYQSGTRQVPRYRDEPEYRPYYHFKVDRWIPGENRVRAGNGLAAEWPNTDVTNPALERMAQRSELYRVHFLERVPENTTEPPRKFEAVLSESEWRSWKDGELVVLNLNVMGGLSTFERQKVEQ